KISVDSVRPLVQQKAGEPYSSEKVNNTIAALEKTGRFTKVQLEVKPEAEGLHLTFTLEPALYFGLLRFPGATKNFRYTRLLQLAEFPTQPPYNKNLFPKAGGAFRRFFISVATSQPKLKTGPISKEATLMATWPFHLTWASLPR